MQVSVDADEDFLDEVLRLLPIADRAVDEIQEARLVPLHELLEGALLPAQKRRDDRSVVHRAKLFADRRCAARRALDHPLHCDVSHVLNPQCLRMEYASTTQIRCIAPWLSLPVGKAGSMPATDSWGEQRNML